ncbi:hypothetical protein OPW36_02775 [Vibrio europaeus]|uniref:hypothetical protein n=1 Tax=Vibrio europaeus TaxID=300876 RepID=UPI00233EE2E9|nr:hypothetical protein [Vibrio europaeus]MDC5823642.1 hypothetical protein [Vibrio europaeus]
MAYYVNPFCLECLATETGCGNGLRPRKLENWKTGKLENWKTGKLENWKTGKLENWKTGKLENWKTGKLENWKTGKLENWKTGKLSCSAVVEKSTLAFQKDEVRSRYLEAERSIGRSPFPLCSRS